MGEYLCEWDRVCDNNKMYEWEQRLTAKKTSNTPTSKSSRGILELWAVSWDLEMCGGKWWWRDKRVKRWRGSGITPLCHRHAWCIWSMALRAWEGRGDLYHTHQEYPSKVITALTNSGRNFSIHFVSAARSVGQVYFNGSLCSLMISGNSIKSSVNMPFEYERNSKRQTGEHKLWQQHILPYLQNMADINLKGEYPKSTYIWKRFYKTNCQETLRSDKRSQLAPRSL